MIGDHADKGSLLFTVLHLDGLVDQGLGQEAVMTHLDVTALIGHTLGFGQQIVAAHRFTGIVDISLKSDMMAR